MRNSQLFPSVVEKLVLSITGQFAKYVCVRFFSMQVEDVDVSEKSRNKERGRGWRGGGAREWKVVGRTWVSCDCG